MAGEQTAIQQLIQQLVPSGVNNGNPNTVYNTSSTPYNGGSQAVPLPPMQNTQGQWFMNSVSNAANLDPRTLTLQGLPPANIGQAWQAPAGIQMRMPTWPTPFDPAQYGTPAAGGGATVPPTTPVPAPPVTGGVAPTAPQGPGVGGVVDTSFTADSWCVVVDSYLKDYDRADEVKVGDVMKVIDPVSFEESDGTVSYSETKTMPCVRVITESGTTLDCSRTAPIADQYGNQVPAPELMNKLIPVCDLGVFYLDRVVSIEDLGDLEVQHITVENNFFLAGKEKGRYMFHHNMKMVPGTGMDLLGMMDGLNARFGGMQSGGFGAEGMGGNGPNTRGAMQANGSWYDRPGISGGNYAPTGQGLVDSFGAVAGDPAIATAPNPWGGLQSDPYSADWFQESQAYQNSLGNAGSVPAGATNDTGGWLDKAANWFDNTVLGNMYDENSNTINKGNILGGVVEGLTGLPVASGAMRMGTANLLEGNGGMGSNYARTQMQQQYDRSSSEQRSQYVTQLAEQYKTTPERILEVIGR